MRPALRRLTIVFGLALLVYVGICALMFFTQNSLIYFPQPRSYSTGVVMLSLPTEAGPVLVSTRPGPGPQAILYFGGNAEDVSQNMPGFLAAFPRRAIYLLHYRGYGGSAGRPSEKALFSDGLALFDRVHAEHPDVVVVGRSLGSGIAVKVASERPVTRVVLITPFDSLADVAAAHYPWLPVRWLMHDKYDSWRYAPLITAPTRIIAAGEDGIIPSSSTERLRARFKPGIASYTVVPGVGHNTISDTGDYFSLIAAP